MSEAAVLGFIRERTGLSLESLRRSRADEVIARYQQRLALGGSTELLRRLRADPGLLEEFASDVTVGETYFFRDRAQLDALRTLALPALRGERAPDHRYRVWSAGCSTGEEAYSLSILLQEEGLGEQASILATDISRPALARAERGEYPAWSFRGTSPEMRDRYFTPVGQARSVAPALRRPVTFSALNLLSSSYPSARNGTAGLDIILCRNVLIYFDEESIQRVAERLYAALAGGGWLILGPSDPPLWNRVPLIPVLASGALLYKRKDHRAAHPAGRRRPAEADGICKTGRPPRPRRAVASGAVTAGDREPSPTLPRQQPGGRSASDYVAAIRSTAAANGVEEAQQLACAAAREHPLVGEIHYLRAILLLALDRRDDAERTLRRLLYLDRSLAVAHLAMGTVLQSRADAAGARRHFHNAYRIAVELPPVQEVSLGEGMTAAALAEIAKGRLAEIKDARERLDHA